MSKNQKRKIALVCTAGGHFEQMTNLSDFYNRYDHFWITNRNRQTEGPLKEERAYFIEMAHFKNPWTYLSQIGPLLKIFFKEKPTHVISTGSGRTAFIPFLLSRVFKIKFICIETYSRVNAHSVFATFLLKTGYHVYTQWEDLRNKNTTYIGPVLKPPGEFNKDPNSNYVFVAVGTREEPFTRLLQGIEDLVKKGVITEKLIIQSGHTKYTLPHAEAFDFCPPEKIAELILNAKYVINQASAGIGTLCLRYKTKFIMMPREYRYGELPTPKDMEEDLHYKLQELGYTRVVKNPDELEEAIRKIEGLKVGFNFDNSLAISTLHKAVEAE
jgi:UDP-N-acetylglucosamine transferase subunit ALG13